VIAADSCLVNSRVVIRCEAILMRFSFVIPAYNEEKNIVNTLDALKKYAPGDFEILVVDHGSSDRTVELAEKNGVSVYIHPEGTIGGLRNYGVRKSSGEILVFLDADVLLTGEWAEHIGGVANQLSNGARILTGSWYSVPDNPNWIESCWFEPLQHGKNTHINSGHLVISRKLFDEISGFDERLETGEDYDISMRAKAAGLQIVDNTQLRVIHEGYPKSLVEFIKREYWHGKGDAHTIKTVLSSKIAVIGVVFVMLHVMLFIAPFVAGMNLVYALVATILIIVFGMSLIKYGYRSLSMIFTNAFLYYCYFWARGISVLSLAGARNIQKRTR
jgi:glycosyltransferase involved in cell wall biosynthesis